MERNVRRRYAGRRTSTRKPAAAPSTDFKSRLLIQCMICGTALAVVLLICIINTQFCNEFRVAIKTAITKQTDMEDIISFADASRDQISNAGDLLNSLFKFSSESDVTDPYLNNSPPDEGVEAISGAVINPNQEVNQNDTSQRFEFRIDEDILSEMNSRTDAYASSKKASAPEPSFTPELR